MLDSNTFYELLVSGQVSKEEFEDWISLQRDEAWQKATSLYSGEELDDLK